MKEINVLSWGGGTQSTALMLMLLKGEIKDQNNEKINLDYIFFADTGNEANFTYKQVYKIQKYVKEKFDKDIIVVKRNKIKLEDKEIIDMIKNGDLKSYRNSEYADLIQSHILFFKGIINSIDAMPFWTRNEKTGKVGKTPFKSCTFEYKIDEIMKNLRKLEGVGNFRKKNHKINIYIGYSVDELGRVKTNPLVYAENKSPLVDMNITKNDCINYVEKELGFRPISSVCNMCYANDFDRVYKIFKEDKKGWDRLLELDEAMKNVDKNHKLGKNKVFMFRWQALLDVRLHDVDMEDLKQKIKEQDKQLSIFDKEESMACMGGCFL